MTDVFRLPDGRPYLPDRVDSWLEQRFAWQAIKYLRPEISLRSQVKISRKVATFRVDFLTENYRVPIAFECDGAAYHQNPQRDAWRDEQLLESGAIRGIYHVPYRDLVEWPEACFLAIAERHYDLFTERAMINLNNLAGGEDGPRVAVTYRARRD